MVWGSLPGQPHIWWDDLRGRGIRGGGGVGGSLQSSGGALRRGADTVYTKTTTIKPIEGDKECVGGVRVGG